MTEVLTAAARNRALLARQLLLEREDVGPAEVVARLAGLQSQAPNPPYLGLWSRIEDFDPADASALLEDRTLVRATLMRGTIHLLTAADLLAWRPLLEPHMERFVASKTFRDALAPLGDRLAEAVAHGAELLHAEPRTAKELTVLLGARWPDVDAHLVAQAARTLTPTVQVTPRGLWQRSGPPAFTTVEAWLGRPVDPAPDLGAFLCRYLAAFGPASVRDAQAWSGLTRLGPTIEELRPQLRSFRDEAGRELFDLPEAPRPPAAGTAPVRLVPEWDNLLLAHADKTHVIGDEHRRRIFTVNGIIHPTVLVGGRVDGMWRITRAAATATVSISPFSSWRRGTIRDVTAEAHRLLAVTDPALDHRVELLDPS